MLRDLATRAAEAKSEDEAWRVAAQVLVGQRARSPAVPALRAGRQDNCAQLVGEGGWRDYEGPAQTAPRADRRRRAPASWPFGEVDPRARAKCSSTRSPRASARCRREAGTRGPSGRSPCPLFHAGSDETPCACLIAGLCPHRAFDDRYREFFRRDRGSARRVDRQRPRLCGRAPARRGAARDRSRQDGLLLQRQPRVPHAAHADARTARGRAARDRCALPARAASGLETAHRNSLRLLKLVNSLLDFSRIEAGRVNAHYEPTDLAALTADLASTFRSALERGGLALTVDCPPLPQDRLRRSRDVGEDRPEPALERLQAHLRGRRRRAPALARSGARELRVEDSGVGHRGRRDPDAVPALPPREGRRARARTKAPVSAYRSCTSS